MRNWIGGVRKFSDGVKNELKEDLRIHELHSDLKKAEKSNLTNLAPEVEESLRTLKEAAEMVNNPFQKSTIESVLNDASKDKEDKPKS